MVEQVKKNNFVDNIAYKNKFQFLLWVNNNAVCQRYFKINGFRERLVGTDSFIRCMNGIVRSIQEDLNSKSRVFMHYTSGGRMKCTGFVSDNDVEKYGEDIRSYMLYAPENKEMTMSDGKVFVNTYCDYGKSVFDFGDTIRPAEGDYVFRFNFLIEDKLVYEKVWDGNVYPKMVRNGVNLANTSRFREPENLTTIPFSNIIPYYLERGRTNLINDFIRRICDCLSSNEPAEDVVYGQNNKPTRDVPRDEQIKVEVLGHVDIEEKPRRYRFASPLETAMKRWDRHLWTKTRKYKERLYPSDKELEYIDRHY